MSHTSRDIPIQMDLFRMRRHIANLNLESDCDSEYANHPPPTDSEIEIEINPAFIHSRQQHSSNYSTPRRYVTENVHPGNVHYNRINSSNRLMTRSADSSIQSSHNNSSSNLMNENSNASRNLLLGLASTATEDLYRQRRRLKSYGLKRLTVRQHILVTICRDIPIYSMLKNFFVLLTQWYKLVRVPCNNLTTVRATEFFLASLWCLVSALLSYTILDGLMVRWMVMYAIQAVIVRILSMSLIIVMVVEIFNYTFNNTDNEFCLTVWIFISCVLTIFFIIQCFISNNLDIEQQLSSKALSNSEFARSRSSTANNSSNNLSSGNMDNYVYINREDNEDGAGGGTEEGGERESKEESGADNWNNRGNSGITGENLRSKFKRKVDLYNLIVFAVVPIGVASFISTVGLVRLLLILRLDIGIEMSRIQQNV